MQVECDNAKSCWNRFHLLGHDRIGNLRNSVLSLAVARSRMVAPASAYFRRFVGSYQSTTLVDGFSDDRRPLIATQRIAPA